MLKTLRRVKLNREGLLGFPQRIVGGFQFAGSLLDKALQFWCCWHPELEQVYRLTRMLTLGSRPVGENDVGGGSNLRSCTVSSWSATQKERGTWVARAIIAFCSLLATADNAVLATRHLTEI
jgi:hypothetical protein